MITQNFNTIELHKFNLTNGSYEIEKYSFDKLIIQSLLDQFNRTQDHTGLQITLTQLTNSEDFIEDFYTNKGYNVKKINPRSTNFQLENDKIIEYFIKNFGQKYDYWFTELNKGGVPDLLIYKEIDNQINDLFMVEVKAQQDSIHFNQIQWHFKNKQVPIFIVFTKEVKA